MFGQVHVAIVHAPFNLVLEAHKAALLQDVATVIFWDELVGIFWSTVMFLLLQSNSWAARRILAFIHIICIRVLTQIPFLSGSKSWSLMILVSKGSIATTTWMYFLSSLEVMINPILLQGVTILRIPLLTALLLSIKAFAKRATRPLVPLMYNPTDWASSALVSVF